ncbi:TonB-dependent receptor [Roseivirga seohaensis subsp. aquiponti]|uniref:TonB-dependent receptor n=2 Tax=Roseivirga seohaensis TaxID=1914963 RepID=A0A0L8AHL1_9BACT|nr:TonB-dependent receptor [Roseivirga seohaensis subsp. aquiponti]
MLSVGFGQTGQVKGLVLDENDNPLVGASVVISPDSLITQTGSKGQFFFSGIPFGEHVLRIAFVGYKHQVNSISLIVNEPQDLTIKLTPDLKTLDDVVILGDSYLTTRKRESSLDLEIVNTEFIRQNLGGSLMQSLERLPGISTIGIGSGQSKPLIRGLGFNRVVVLDKGVKHEGQQWGADHGLELDQFATGEVELLKGPASFAYGSDAIGGAINVLPPAPPSEINSLGGSLNLIGKSNNGLIGTSLNLFGRKQELFFGARYSYQRYGDYRVPTDVVYVYDYAVNLDDNYLRNSAGKESGLNLEAGYVVRKFKNTIYLSHVYNKSGFFANAHGLEPRRVDTELHDNSNRDIQMPRQQVNHYKVINRSVYETGNHKLEADLGYQHNFRQEFSPYVNHGFMPANYPAESAIPSNLEREFNKSTYTLNLRDQISLLNHTINLGVSLEHQDNTIDGWGFLVPAYKQLTNGVFVHDEIDLNKRLLVSAALRYDYGRISINEYLDWFDSVVTNSEGEEVSQRVQRAKDMVREFSNLAWSLGLNYNMENLLLKINFGKGFRMPIAKELAANGVNYHYFSYEKGNPDLSPEQSYQLDLGINWLKSDWSIQVSPFLNYFPNYIFLNPTPDHDYYYGAGNQVFEYSQSKVIRYGGEVKLSLNLTEEVSTELFGEYVFSQQLSGDKKGFTLPFSPPPSALLNFTWSPILNKTFKAPYFSLDYRIVGKQNNIVPPEKKTFGYQVFNFRAGTNLELYKQELQLNFQVQNVMNTHYMNHTSFYRLINLPEMGRNFILSVSLSL